MGNALRLWCRIIYSCWEVPPGQRMPKRSLPTRKFINPVNICGTETWGMSIIDTYQKTASLAQEMQVKACKQFLDCGPCKQKKTYKASVNQKRSRQSKRIFELVHADCIGPSRPTFEGSKYVFLVTDDYSRYSFCCLLKEKSECFWNSSSGWAWWNAGLAITLFSCKSIEGVSSWTI